MKKSILTIALTVLALAGATSQASAQTAPAKAQAPANVQAVDLGLPSGLKWASCNVGATTPEDYGNYYAWGEVLPKDNYSWTTYAHANGSANDLTKYCSDATLGNDGFTDNLTTLEPEDDAATANWGGEWRMPTEAEWIELRTQCTWTWMTQSGVNGYQVTSKTNSNSIFLPAAGYRYDETLSDGGSYGNYWASSLFEKNSGHAWGIGFYSGLADMGSYTRCYGQSVRPVQDKQEDVVEPAYTPKPFTVAEGKQITFSGGNLQYTQSTQTWAFADNQYDMLGDANVSGSALADKIDLFGWSGSIGSAKWGISTSQSNSAYSGDFVDWGTNTIGTDAPNTWRTLTHDEWDYLLKKRLDAAQLNGVARIQFGENKYANGLVLLPDNWICPAGVTFKSGFAGEWSVQAYADYQTFTLADWRELEASGAVFLPASGYRDESLMSFEPCVNDVQSYGHYWSATPDDLYIACYLYFNSSAAGTNCNFRNYGRSVRLVKNYSNVSTDAASPATTDIGEVRKVLRNGQVLIERGGKTYTLQGVEVK